MPKFDVLVARFPGGHSEHPATTDYLLKIQTNAIRGKVGGVTLNLQHWRISDTPITMGRNDAIQEALRRDVHFLLMIDSDMAPDLYLGRCPYAKPFLETSIEFMLKSNKPCVVGAPYCGPPPHENVYVFSWQNIASNKAGLGGASLEQYSRQEAGVLRGIQKCGALPTGLILFDMRALKNHPYPHTYYEFEGDSKPCEKCHQRTPGPQARKASTEDVTLTRDLSLRGVPIYCNWDAWCGHFKLMCVGKPIPITSDMVGPVYAQAVRENRKVDEGVMFFGDPDEKPSDEEIREAMERTRRMVDVRNGEDELSMTDGVHKAGAD